MALDAARAHGGQSRALVLFVPRHATSFAKMLPQCRLLSGRPGLRPVMLLADPRTYGYAQKCLSEGVEALSLEGRVGDDPVDAVERRWQAVAGRLSAPLRRLLLSERIAHSLPVAWWRRRSVVAAYAAQRAVWESVLRELAPAVVMMPGDRELGFVPPLLAAARAAGVPTVISTSNIPTVDSLAASRADRLRFTLEPRRCPLLWNMVAARRHPGQVAETPRGRLLFSPGWLVSALNALGMLSQRPWTQGGGNSDHVLLDGPRKKRLFLELGAPAEKLRVVGDLAHDELHRAHELRETTRRELCLSAGFDSDRPLVVLAVPIFAEHGLLSWPFHLKSLRRFAGVLAARSANVLLSLHPKSDPSRYAFLHDDFGFRFSERPLARLLPAGDLLVCGNSSTIDWAILCRLPVINLDYAELDDAAFADCPAVLKAHTPEEFAAALDRFDSARDELRRLQEQAARDLAEFDGRAGERFASFVESLVRHGREAAVARA